MLRFGYGIMLVSLHTMFRQLCGQHLIAAQHNNVKSVR